MKTILTAGQSVTLVLPSGVELNVEVMQDTLDVTVEDNVLFSQDLTDGAWETTWPKALVGMILGIILLCAPVMAGTGLRVRTGTATQLRYSAGRGGSNGGSGYGSNLGTRPVWFGPMMQDYFSRTYGIRSMSYPGINGWSSGSPGYTDGTGPRMYYNQYVK